MANDSSTPPPETEPILDVALQYGDKGFRVFPCLPGRKEPAIKAWQNHATSEPRTIRGWFSEFPDRNLAVATGPQPNGMNLLAIDIDPGHGGLDSWRDLMADFGSDGVRNTAIHKTPHGGFHLFFNAPEDFRNSRNKLGQGIDTRGAGGYVVVPPSSLFLQPGDRIFYTSEADLWSV